MKFVLNWLVNAVALYVAAKLLRGITVESTDSLFLAALVIGLVNAIVRPLLLILTLPITVLTLGIFYFVLNGLMLYLAAELTPGFTIAGHGRSTPDPTVGVVAVAGHGAPTAATSDRGARQGTPERRRSGA